VVVPVAPGESVSDDGESEQGLTPAGQLAIRLIVEATAPWFCTENTCARVVFASALSVSTSGVTEIAFFRTVTFKVKSVPPAHELTPHVAVPVSPSVPGSALTVTIQLVSSPGAPKNSASCAGEQIRPGLQERS
jgi:hypothetical protein